MTIPAPLNDVALRRKVALRVLPPVFLIYVIAYLDRANVGFAKLRMAGDLKFSEEVFGLGFGIFFIGYLLLEIPGALIVERWSARKWFARILISWGVLSALTAFVHTPMQFYIARFLLGVAEAGFFPGIIVYFTHWFASGDRSRALSCLLVAVPFSLAAGAPVSALLLDARWLNLAGWQWLFIIEGLPAVLIGFATLLWMTDRPRDAKWLVPEERSRLENILAGEDRAKEVGQRAGIWNAFRLPNVWLLAAGIFTANTGGYALSFWLATILKNLSGGSNHATLLYCGLFYGFGLVSVLWSGQSSDRTGDRKWHCVIGMAATGLLLIASAIPGQPFVAVMGWLCLTALAAFFWASPFWSLPTLTLTGPAAAVSIGFINVFANLAGYFGNYTMGWLKQRSFDEGVCLMFLAGCYLIGSIFVSFVKLSPTSIPVKRFQKNLCSTNKKSEM